MKKTITGTLITVIILIAAVMTAQNVLEEDNHQQVTPDSTKMHRMHMADNRISLNLPPHMARHQLMNMRNHLKAVRSIINLMARHQTDSAATIAHTQLGLTPEMKKMCSSFENREFVTLGMQFHESADVLSEELKTGNTEKALTALSNTLNFCIQCHATFKQ